MTPTRLARRTVVIVGGGLTAGLVARQLTAAGIDTLVLERGPDRRNSAAARLPSQRDELRWSIRQGLVQDWSVSPVSLRHDRTKPSWPIRWMSAFLPGDGLGGAASHWNGQAWRWSEYDPVLRSHLVSRYGQAAIPADMPLADWGVTYAQMEPYHDLFEKLFGIAGKAGNLRGQRQAGGNPFEAPRQNEYPQAPLQAIEAGLMFGEAAASMGHHPFIQPGANSPAPYVNPDGQRLGACQYCGHCERFICEAQAKGTPEVLLYPVLERRAHFEVRLHAHVLGVRYDAAAKRVKGVRYVDLNTGREYEQPADVVVLGAFTLTNTRLLLLDRIGAAYDPRAGKGGVGSHLCYQTLSGVELFFKDRWINPFLASGCTGTIIDDLNNDNFDHAGLGFLGGGSVAAGVSNGRPIASRMLPDGTPRWGTAWKAANAQWYAHSFGLWVQGSCYPHRENFFDLEPHYTDAFGQPLLRLTFDFRENEVRMSSWVTQKVTAIARAMQPDHMSGGQGLKPPFDTRIYQTTHLTGGTPMGPDPGHSVVSPHLQHWDAANLFVVGASVYPHNSGFNPTGPLAALALRLGDDLVDYVRRPRMLG